MVATTLEELVQNPYASKSYIVILKAYDFDTSSEVTLYLSDRGYVSGPAETPANTYFAPRVIEALNFEQAMFTSGSIGGFSKPSFGEIVLSNADGDLDAYAQYAWDDRDVEVRVGEKGGDLSEHFTIFTGQAKSVEFTDLEVRVIIRDGQDKFTRSFPPNSYAGTGGNEGSAIMEGFPKPICLGEVYNISPVLVVESTTGGQVYQVHDGEIEAIDAVYENGVSISGYTTDLTNGRFTVTGTITGIITADVRGGKYDSTYIYKAGDLLETLAVEYAGLPAGSCASDTIADLNTANGSTLGVYINRRTTVLEVMDQIANSVGAFFGFCRAGNLIVGRIEAPTGTADLELDSTNIIELERLPTDIPKSTVIVQYKKNYTILSEDELDSGADDPDFMTRESASTSDTDAAVAAIYPNAEFLEVDSRFVDSTAASTEATRLLALYGTQRDIYRIRCKAQPYTVRLNDIVNVTFPRYDLSSGKKFLVIGMFENAAINEVTLELWG